MAVRSFAITLCVLVSLGACSQDNQREDWRPLNSISLPNPPAVRGAVTLGFVGTSEFQQDDIAAKFLLDSVSIDLEQEVMVWLEVGTPLGCGNVSIGNVEFAESQISITLLWPPTGCVDLVDQTAVLPVAIDRGLLPQVPFNLVFGETTLKVISVDGVATT